MHRYLSLISWIYQLQEIECSQESILQFAVLSLRDIQLQMQLGLTRCNF